jgi:SAM-dependent methyltransferase
VVAKFGAYVTALERSPELVQEGQNQNTVHDVDDKVTHEVLDPEEPKFKTNYFVAALARDAFLNIENKNDLLDGLIQSLKPEGQIVITDLLYDEDADGPEMAAWKEIEPEPVYPWSIGDIKQVFAAENVLLRIANDDSDIYRSMVLSAWAEFMQKIKAREVDDELMGMLLWEAELWARRIAAMETGQLKYHRIVGIKNP